MLVECNNIATRRHCGPGVSCVLHLGHLHGYSRSGAHHPPHAGTARCPPGHEIGLPLTWCDVRNRLAREYPGAAELRHAVLLAAAAVAAVARLGAFEGRRGRLPGSEGCERLTVAESFNPRG